MLVRFEQHVGLSHMLRWVLKNVGGLSFERMLCKNADSSVQTVRTFHTMLVQQVGTVLP